MSGYRRPGCTAPSSAAAALGRARSGRGGVLRILGEPGAGETRLADALAALARERDVRVGWAQSWEGAGPYGIVLEALRSARSDLSALPASPRSREETFEALRAAVEALPPSLLVLDDLHGADPDSLAFVRWLAPRLRNTPVLLVGNERSVATGATPEAAALLAELAQDAATVAALHAHGASTGQRRAALDLLETDAPADLAARLRVTLALGDDFLRAELWVDPARSDRGDALTAEALDVARALGDDRLLQADAERLANLPFVRARCAQVAARQGDEAAARRHLDRFVRVARVGLGNNLVTLAALAFAADAAAALHDVAACEALLPLLTPYAHLVASVAASVCVGAVWDLRDGKLAGLRNDQDAASILRQIGAA